MLCEPLAMASVFQSLAISEAGRSSSSSCYGARVPCSSPYQRPSFLKLRDLHSSPCRNSSIVSFNGDQLGFSVATTEEAKQHDLDLPLYDVGAQQTLDTEVGQQDRFLSLQDGALETLDMASSTDTKTLSLPVRFAHLSELFSQLCAGADVPSVMDSWLHKLTLSDWNQLLIECGRKDIDIALGIMAFYREKAAVLDYGVFFSEKIEEQAAASGTEELHDSYEESDAGISEQTLEKDMEAPQGMTVQVEQEDLTKKLSEGDGVVAQSPPHVEISSRINSASLKLYTTLTRILTRKRRFDEIDKVEMQLEEAGLKPNVHFYNALLDSYIERRSLSKAFEIVQHMKFLGFEPHIYTHEKLARVYMNEEDSSVAVLKQLAEDLKSRNSAVSGTLYQNLLKAHWEANDVASADEAFEALVAAGHSPEMKDFLKIMQLNGRRGKHERVVELIELMVKCGFKPIESVYDFLIHAYCKSGLLEKALETFGKFESVLDTKPTIVAINMLIDGYGKQGLDKEALQVFEGMKDYGYRPTQVSYSSTISAVAQVGKFQLAGKLFDKMRKTGTTPNLHTYLTLIRSYTKCNQTREGHKIYNALRKYKVFMSDTAFSVCLALYVDGNWYQHAAALLNEIEEKGVVLDATAHSSLIRSFASLQSRSNPLARAVQESKMKLCKVLTSLFDATWERRKLESSLTDAVYSILEEWRGVSSLEAKSLVYNAFMDYFWRKGYKELAKEILDMGREVYAGFSRPRLVDTEWVLDVRGLGVGGAKVALKDWLFQEYEVLGDEGGEDTKMILITGDEFSLSIPQDNRMVKAAISSLFRELASPFVESPNCSSRFEASLADTLNWVSEMKLSKPASFF